MSYIFVYGTLQDPDVVKLVLGHDEFDLSPHKINHYRVVRARGEDFPVLISGKGETKGALLYVTEKDLERLKFYEGDEFILKDISDSICAFFPSDDSLITNEPWTLEGWNKEAFLKKLKHFLDTGEWVSDR